VSDDPSQARAAGKSRVQASILWELKLGPMALRCLPRGEGYVAQARDSKGWQDLMTGKSPFQLLRAVVLTPAVAKALP
jgi:hypothetical protein